MDHNGGMGNDRLGGKQYINGRGYWHNGRHLNYFIFLFFFFFARREGGGRYKGLKGDRMQDWRYCDTDQVRIVVLQFIKTLDLQEILEI